MELNELEIIERLLSIIVPFVDELSEDDRAFVSEACAAAADARELDV